MGWEKGRYYTRSGKVDGKVVREYFGCGELGEAAARKDAMRREFRNWERECWRLEKEEIEAFDASVAEICKLADVVAQGTLTAAGYHHHRGQWRRRRAQKEE